MFVILVLPFQISYLEKSGVKPHNIIGKSDCKIVESLISF